MQMVMVVVRMLVVVVIRRLLLVAHNCTGTEVRGRSH